MAREGAAAPVRFLLVAALTILAVPCAPRPLAAQDPSAPPAAQPIGTTACRACHALETDHWTPTIHGRLAAAPRSEAQARGCESCHGPGSRHLADPRDPAAIVSFTRGSRAAVEAQRHLDA